MNVKKYIIALASVLLVFCTRETPEKNLKVQGQNLVSNVPAFTIALPSPFQLVDSSSTDYPEKSSMTRVYLLVNEKKKEVEQLLIVQIADKTDPQAEPMSVPRLTSDTDMKLYLKNRVIKEKTEIEYLIQLISWNPQSPSLQPIIKREIGIPVHWALQGQILFSYGGEHAVFIKYSRDVNSFGMKVSEKGESWDKESISGNETKVYEAFQKDFTGMIDSLTFKKP
jgi:hypothetical protein